MARWRWLLLELMLISAGAFLVWNFGLTPTFLAHSLLQDIAAGVGALLILYALILPFRVTKKD